jgi:hypothetical protein
LSMKSCENQRSASICVPDMHVCALFDEEIHNTNFAYLPRQEADWLSYWTSHRVSRQVIELLG